MKAATNCANRICIRCSISIHAAREGGDAIESSSTCLTQISIHAAREGGDCKCRRRFCPLGISIHAAREGGDGISRVFRRPRHPISIHAAREGGDQTSEVDALYNRLFQSTPPVKAATFFPCRRGLCMCDFNPRRP